MTDNDRNYITVRELNFYLKSIITNEELLRNMYLTGEVSGAKLSGGYLYFDLKDESARISVCCFNPDDNYNPSNGDKVLLRGSPDFYERTGRLSFKAYKIEPFGLGLQFKELEKLKARLANEGIFAEENKKKIPDYPKTVVLVTSFRGAVVQDMLSTIRKYNDIINIIIKDVKVQGVGAAESIAKGLADADKVGADVVILARGGGSFEDFAPFNSETVAYALYRMRTPVISAVGHETDFSVSDMAADMRALTPTAAAEVVAYDKRELLNSIVRTVNNAKSIVFSKIDKAERDIISNIKFIKYKARAFTDNKIYEIEKSLSQIREATEKRFFRAESSFIETATRLDAVNPSKLLTNGYFKLSLSDGTLIRSVKELCTGSEVKIYGGDGMAVAEIKNVIEYGRSE